MPKESDGGTCSKGDNGTRIAIAASSCICMVLALDTCMKNKKYFLGVCTSVATHTCVMID